MAMKNALCCFVLLVLVFGGCLHLPFVAPIVAFCCSPLLFLVFEIESILSEKQKQANAFCCSLWLFVARFGILWMFPFEHRIARCGFSLVQETKTSNKAWFPFGPFVSFVARLGFFLPVLVFPATMSVAAFVALPSFLLLFIAFSLSVVALSGFSLLLISTTFQKSRIGENE